MTLVICERKVLCTKPLRMDSNLYFRVARHAFLPMSYYIPECVDEAVTGLKCLIIHSFLY